MNEYYELLGLSPRASKAEVKTAFLSLCKEYHPDKLPPGTPEKARRLVEEHFKKINEAYQVLSEQEPPPQHPVNAPVSRTPDQAWHPQPAPEPETPPQYRGIFNPRDMSNISEKLEHERQEIELEYQRRLKEIHQTMQRRMTALGLHQGHLQAVTGQGKITFVTLYSLLVLLCMMLMSFMAAQLPRLWLIRFPLFRPLIYLLILAACLGLVGFGIMAIRALMMPVVSQAIFNQAQQVKRELHQATTKAQLQRTEAQNQWQRNLRQQIDFYKTIPIFTLTLDYVERLEPEHQFFLLQALRERMDFVQMEPELREVAQITISMGIMNILFGPTAVKH